MKTSACFVPLITAVLIGAGPNKQMCGDTADVTDTNPTCKGKMVPSAFEPAFLNISKYIWTGENTVPEANNPVGTRAFRKNITSACGKCATCATIVVAADDSSTVYVNGVAIGSGAGWTTGQVYFAPLNPSSNLFAIAGVNNVARAALMATINIHYSDGTHETFITDESWKTVRGAAPQGFQLPATSDSTWTFAMLQGFPQNSFWGNPALPPVLPLAQSKWIWTSANAATTAPAASNAFRKTIDDCTKVAVCATVLISADNHYKLYVNGQAVGSGDSFGRAEAYSIPKLHPTLNTFAIDAKNDEGPAGVIATIHITYRDGTNQTIATDGSWKASQTVPNGFQETFFDDSDWVTATVVGNYGIAPWGSAVAIPPA
uniref:Lectin n=1 Tax=Pleurotus cornucopiae TaxID=5321 RepID=Q765W9_PLECO|nr:lectin [Pleurotus cornucopiae]